MTAGNGGAAPADQRLHRTWPLWQKILAYLILAIIASASIWFVDREAMQVQFEQGSLTPGR